MASSAVPMYLRMDDPGDANVATPTAADVAAKLNALLAELRKVELLK